MTGIEAVFFDAVGTLIHPEPPAGETYARVGKRFRTRCTDEQIAQRFAAAFKREEEIDRAHSWQTSEERERRRWQAIVAAVLDDVSDPDQCFRLLYDHFAQPRAWRCEAETAPLLRRLAERGYQLGIASNYDHRLRSVIAGIDALHYLHHVVISAEAGWRKPAPQFFAAVCRTVRLPPAQILFVGDDPINDHQGARAAGMHSILVDDAGGLRALEELLVG